MGRKRCKLDKQVEYQTIDINKLQKANWNYKKDDESKMQKLIKAMRKRGQIVNLIVRPIGKGKYEVINGNHRYDALKSIGAKTAYCCNLKKVSDHEARLIATETNHLEFETDTASFARMIEEISREVSIQEMEETIPFDEKEINGYIDMINFDWTKLDSVIGESSDTNKTKEKSKETTCPKCGHIYSA